MKILIGKNFRGQKFSHFWLTSFLLIWYLNLNNIILEGGEDGGSGDEGDEETSKDKKKKKKKKKKTEEEEKTKKGKKPNKSAILKMQEALEEVCILEGRGGGCRFKIICGECLWRMFYQFKLRGYSFSSCLQG